MNNKQLVIVLATILYIWVSIVNAQPTETPEDYFTEPESIFVNEGMINGEIWSEFGHEEKIGYLFGYEDGFISASVQFIPDQETRDKACGSLPTSQGDDVSPDYLIKELDKFYSESKNITIPVPYVLLIVRDRLVGVDEAKIEKYIEYLLKQSNEYRQ